MASASVVPPYQPAYCSGYSSAHPTWTLGGTQHSLHGPRQIDCCVRGRVIPNPHWTGRGFIQSVSGCVYSQWMTFKCGWCRPAGQELCSLNLQTAFHSWLINTFKNSLVAQGDHIVLAKCSLKQKGELLVLIGASESPGKITNSLSFSF